MGSDRVGAAPGTRAFDATVVLARLCELPGGRELLDVASRHDAVELIGGAVRDLALGRTPRELDVVVGDDAEAFAHELSSHLGELDPCATFHERFGTALVRGGDVRIDVATRRAETYSAPGALPDVRTGTPEEDLRRRDFTVNAIAVSLSGSSRGEPRAAEHALEDLARGRLRVLHDASFIDDPTRLLRLARYRARLGFEIEGHTAELARRAVARGALATVSGARIGAELRLALCEPDALAALAAMGELGLLGALDPRLQRSLSERSHAIERALALLPEDGRRDLLVMAGLLLPLGGPPRSPDADPRAEIVALLDRLEFVAGDRDRVSAATISAPRLVDELPAARRPSELRAIVAGTPPEGVALAGGAREQAAEPARRWLEDLRPVRLRIDGDDLLAAGIPEGPEIGRRLEQTLRRRLDGEVPDERAAQLRAALREPAG
jgi:tRNA nucleotidyltransferase (CCA-adding enzyme)